MDGGKGEVADPSHPHPKVPNTNIVQRKYIFFYSYKMLKFLNSVSALFSRLSGQVAKNWAVPSNGAISTSAGPTPGYLGRLLSLVTTTQRKCLTNFK